MLTIADKKVNNIVMSVSEKYNLNMQMCSNIVYIT